MNQIIKGQQMADHVADVAGQADQVVLAKYSAEDYPNVIGAGFATVSFEEYNQRLAGAVSQFEQQGRKVVIVPVTAVELCECMGCNDLPNTPDGRAAAIGFMHTRCSIADS